MSNPWPDDFKPVFCLVVQRGYQQFPAVCRRFRDHEEPHKSSFQFADTAGAVEWEDGER